jgi:heme A synthase
MHDFALNAHSGFRYLVLLLAVLTALYALVGMLQKKPVDRAGLTMLRVLAASFDLQVVLGIVTLATGPFRSQLIGHIVMMIAAVAVVHLGAVRLKKTAPEARSNGLLLATSLIPLLLVIAGILAIQRPIV